MLNKIILMGRLTRDPEKRYTRQGTPVASFSLAVDRDYKEQGSNERPTDFIDCTAWRGTADLVSKYFTKGRMAVVEGRLQMEEWTDENGKKRRSAKVVVDSIYFGDSKSKPAAEGCNADQRDIPPQPRQEFADAEDDGQLPF